MEQAGPSEIPEPSSSSSFQFDVFVSSTGSGECKQFVDRLCCVFKQVGVRNFRESNVFEEEMEMGKLMEAIEESEILIPIFSATYAESERCLMEVQKFMEVRGINVPKRRILPVFYHIEPRDVRHQWGPFATAFDQHDNNGNLERTTVNNWREALTEAAKLSGYDIGNSGHEEKIQAIVNKVLEELNKSHPLCVVEEMLVGIDSQAYEVLRLLEVGVNDVRLVVIHGMGGIGKTTLATSVYNQIYQNFESCSFISNIREEVARTPTGLVAIKKQLMYDIYESRYYQRQVNDDGRATCMLLERILGSNKVLIVLDDIDERRLLQELIGSQNTFKEGSRIIVTTRDEKVIDYLNWEPRPAIFRVKELDREQSLQLFSCHAFGMDHEDLNDSLLELSKKAVDAVGGLPLALKVLGSNLCGVVEAIYWDEILKYPRVHLHDVFRRLRRSYDDLNENEKAIFLDIACFFNGIDKETAIFVWNACGFLAVTSVNGLCKKSLLKITDEGILQMHAVLCEMGKNIVYENGPNPTKRSRLWVNEEILDVLEQRRRTHWVEGISLIMEKQFKDEEVLNNSICNNSHLDDAHGDSENDINDGNVRTVCTDGFESLYRLRLLTLKHVHFAGSYENIPKRLKWLQWHGCPLEAIPDELNIMEVAALDLSYSNITQLRSMTEEPRITVFRNLKVLNMTACNRIVTTPDFTAVPNLVKLILDSCQELMVIHASIERLASLILLSMSKCIRLRELPDSVAELTSLERLNLSGCVALENAPNCIRNQNFPRTLDISGCINLQTTAQSY